MLVVVVIVAVAGAAYFFMKGPQEALPTPTPAVGESVTYTSEPLGVTFAYVQRTDYGTVSVREEGNRIYVFPSDMEPRAGQFVEVFDKRTDETFEASIRRQILAGFPSPDCRIELARSNIYSGAWVAEISYPPQTSAEEPFWANAKLCNERYAQANGIRYFLYDDRYPDHFVYLDIGQYAIPGRDSIPWHETLRITER